MLSRDDFLSVVRLTPLVSIDLIVTRPDGAALVGRRVNRPAQGTWFVPGGRIRKDETLDDAFRRIVTDELGPEPGVSPLRRDAGFLGVYEHFYPDNFAGTEGIGTHYVVLAYRATVADTAQPGQAAQHSAYRWMSPAELLADPAVHDNTRAYFAGGTLL